jgi:alpha-D-ribose 1-methylphosphonate 5-triphosphate synthase subunit PhnH
MGPSGVHTLPAVARLSSDESRRVFRSLLDAVSRPGKVVELSAAAPVDPVVLPALALADLEVGVAVVGDVERAVAIGRMLRRSTGAAIVEPSLADLVLAIGQLPAVTVGSLRRGDAARPEAGARLVVEAARVASVDATTRRPPGPAWVTLWLMGPGARSGRLVAIEGVPADVFEALQVANSDHPAGIDTWIVDIDGTCVGIPRSCRIEIVAEEGRWDT